MVGKSLMKDVSISDLLAMRDSGMTNKEIAVALDVSLATIYKYIGAQPPQMRRGREQARTKLDAQSKTDAPCNSDDAEEAALIVDNRTISLAGLFAGYRIDVRSKTVVIFLEDDVDAMVVPFDKVRDFARELNALAKHVGSMKIGSEAW